MKADKSTEKPEQNHDGQGGDDYDRTQSELTEANLIAEERNETHDPKERDKLEGELEEMEDEIQEANED